MDGVRRVGAVGGGATGIAGREGGRKGGREEGTTNLNPNPNLTVGSGLPVVLAVHLRNREQSQFVLCGVFSK